MSEAFSSDPHVFLRHLVLPVGDTIKRNYCDGRRREMTGTTVTSKPRDGALVLPKHFSNARRLLDYVKQLAGVDALKAHALDAFEDAPGVIACRRQ